MTQVVSAAVVVERPEEGHALPVERSVYFISEVLSIGHGSSHESLELP